MNEEKKLVPKLRFPEFWGADAWGTQFGNILFDQISDRNREPGLPVLAITQEHGAIPRHMIDYHVSVTEKSIESYKVVQVGDFIISLRSFQGGIEYSQYYGICSPAYVVLRRRCEGNDAYFRYYLKTEQFIKILTKNLEGLRDGKMISYKQFSELRLPVPASPEQQKIADCLSSLDELMAAQARKVDALKTHKKGLMQQLFPREGENQPRLRFPELQNAGEWKLKNLKQLATYTKGFAFKSKDYRNEGTRVIRVSDLGADFIKSDNEKIYIDARSASDHERYKLGKGEIIITTVGSKPELIDSAVGRGIFVTKSDEGLLNQNLLKLEMLSGISSRFLFCNINTSSYQNFIISISRGNANQANIAVKELMDFEVMVPSHEEQKRIASCLSSLDALITLETQKLETFKTKKKGLMQQIFPPPEEAEA